MSRLPLLVISIIIYALVVLMSGGAPETRLAGDVFAIHMISGQEWHVTLGGFLLIVSLLLFFGDILRSAGPSRRSVIRNVIEAVIFIPCLVLFLLVKGFATTEFFMLSLMVLLTFMADSVILVLTSRRTVEYEHS